MKILPAELQNLQDLTDLCFRSKAHWGYHTSFMASCADELTFTKNDLEESLVAFVIERDRIVGVAQLRQIIQLGLPTAQVELEKLFIDPDAKGRGVGRSLFKWAVSSSQLLNADELMIVSDPNAADFYIKMGADLCGHVTSETWEDRWLPFFRYQLKKTSTE